VRSAGEITAVIGISPTREYEKGDIISRKSPKPVRRQNSMWMIESGLPESADIEDHILSLCDKIQPCSEALNSLRSDCDVDIFCGYFSESGQAGFSLSNQVLGRVVSLGLDLIFDVYP
jgi:hypothetical protein